MSLAQRKHFLLDGFQMTIIAIVSAMSHYRILEFDLFLDTLLTEGNNNYTLDNFHILKDTKIVRSVIIYRKHFTKIFSL